MFASTLLTALCLSVFILRLEASRPLSCGGSYSCSDCSNSHYIGVLEKNLDISPGTPERGGEITVEATIDLKQKIYGGNLVLKIKKKILWFWITALTMKFDVCKIALYSKCPLEGEVKVKFNVHISSLAPGGSYSGNAMTTGSTDDGELPISCINFTFKL